MIAYRVDGKYELICSNCHKLFGYYHHIYEPIEEMIPPPKWICIECENVEMPIAHIMFDIVTKEKK